MEVDKQHSTPGNERPSAAVDLKALLKQEKQRIIFMKAADDVDMEEKHLVLLTTMSALKINWQDFVKFYESKCTVK